MSRKLINPRRVWATEGNVQLVVGQGTKSDHDFIVRYKEPGKAQRTPQHVHLIVDLYLKRMGNRELTSHLVDHIINNILKKVQASNSYPPAMQVFDPTCVEQFKPLEQYGEYSIEFLLVVIEFIMIQEKTNYPTGTITIRMFEKFRAGADIFSVISASTFSGMKRG